MSRGKGAYNLTAQRVQVCYLLTKVRGRQPKMFKEPFWTKKANTKSVRSRKKIKSLISLIMKAARAVGVCYISL